MMIELLGKFFPACRAQSIPKFAVLGQSENRIGQRYDGFRRQKKTGDAVQHDFPSPVDVVADNRLAR